MAGMTMPTSSSKSTLPRRAELLQELLKKDGIEITLEDAKDLLLAEAVERLKVKVSA